MKKQTIAILAGILLVLLFVIIGQVYVRQQSKVQLPSSKVQELVPPGEDSPTPVVPTIVIDATVIIDFGNGTKWSEKVSGTNVYEATVKLVKAKGAMVEEKQYKYGKMIEKIGDTANSKNGYWSYSVNGKPGLIAADRQVIYPGDKIEWKFMKQ